MGGASRSRANKRKRAIYEQQLKKVTHYYPILEGWTNRGYRPIFNSPSAALCYQLSRYMKDSLCYSPHLPSWLYCVGGITVSDSDLAKGSILSPTNPSQIEKDYFCGIKVYKLTSGVTSIDTVLLQATSELFTECMSTFQSFPDYQSSSRSIYNDKMSCIDKCSGFNHASLHRLKVTRDDVTGFYSVGRNSRAHFKNKCDRDIDDVIGEYSSLHCIVSYSFLLIYH